MTPSKPIELDFDGLMATAKAAYSQSTSNQMTTGFASTTANVDSPYNSQCGGYGWATQYYPPVYSQRSKLEQAFSVARKLLDKKLIEVDTVKQFLVLIDTLVGAL